MISLYGFVNLLQNFFIVILRNDETNSVDFVTAKFKTA